MIVMLIGVFYTFVFCMVGDLSDTSSIPVSASVQPSDSVTAYELTFPAEETTKSTTARTDVGGLTGVNFQAGHPAQNATLVNEAKQTEKQTSAKATTSAPKATTTAAQTVPAVQTTTAPAVTTTETTTTVQTTTVPETTTQTTTQATTVQTTTQATTVQTTTEQTTTAKPVANGNDTITYKLNGTTYTDSAYEVVCRMVQKEMGPSFDEEALKAQAVATYSYMKYFNNRGVAQSAAMSSSSAVSQKVRDAVSEVIGEGIYYNGEICQAVYCASSGGYTASAEDVWGGYVPYLVSVESEYDSSYDYNYGKTVSFSEDYVRSKLESYTGLTLSDDPDNWIQILSTVDGDYVGDVSIDGKKTVSGRDVREKIFGFGLRSAKFDVSYDNGSFTFTTYGYGHGVGMPQNGANYYAKYEGYDYIEILEHYYTGVTVQ